MFGLTSTALITAFLAVYIISYLKTIVSINIEGSGLKYIEVPVCELFPVCSISN